MLKALAGFRTIVLVFLVVFTARSMPIFIAPARTFDETYARCAQSVDQLQRAAWLAIGWVGIECIIGWIMASRRKKEAASAAAAAPR
jgi:heme A synthase